MTKPTFIKIYSLTNGVLKWGEWQPYHEKVLDGLQMPFATIIKDWEGRRDRQPDSNPCIFKCAVFLNDVANPVITKGTEYTELLNAATSKVRAFCKANRIKTTITKPQSPEAKRKSKEYKSRPEYKEQDRIRMRLRYYVARQTGQPLADIDIGAICDYLAKKYKFEPKTKPSKFMQAHEYLLTHAQDYF